MAAKHVVDYVDQNGDEEEWREKNIRGLIRTKSVEDTLAPLIMQVTTLVHHGGRRERGTHKVTRLAQAVDKAVDKFVEEGEKIAQENPKIQADILKACRNVSTAGQVMHEASSAFATEPQSMEHRAAMVQASRNLLLVVTRLLIVADVADVSKLINVSSRVESRLQGLSNVDSMNELVEKLKLLGPDIANLLHLAERRQKDLKSYTCREALASARATLTRTSKMLMTSTKVYLEHRNLQTAQINRSFVLEQMCEAVSIISQVADGQDPKDPVSHCGQLVSDVTSFIVMLDQPLSTQQLQLTARQRMEVIVSAAANMATSEYTRDLHQDQITTECNAVRVQFHKLLQLCTAGQHSSEAAMEKAHLIQRGLDLLRREMCRAVSDHVSDIFLDVTSPSTMLVEGAQQRDATPFEQSVDFFTSHAEQMSKVADLCSSMCTNEEANKLLNTVSKQFNALTPQLVNAAKTAVTTTSPRSNKTTATSAAHNNLLMFRDVWQEMASLLTDAVDNATVMHDFLAVSELHIQEDMKGCLEAVRARDHQMLDQQANLVRGRCMRMLHAVQCGMAERTDQCSGDQLECVNQVVVDVRNKALSSFSMTTDKVYNRLMRSHDPTEEDMATVEAAVLNMRDSIYDLRRTVAKNVPPEEIEGDEELEELLKPPRPASPLDYDENFSPSTSSLFTRTLKPSISNPGTHDGAQERMAQLPAEQLAQLAKESADLSMEQSLLENEMNKWEDSSYQNDAIVIAKEMCLMMMDMSDFTRGQGPLKSTMDVIWAAQEIARAGNQLDEMTREIALQCPHEGCRKDLQAYLQRVKLCAHQLKITSAVKADLSSSVRETVESASALIASAKNLMQAVALTVKAAYVACCAITRVGGSVPSSVMQWRMDTPKKKQLVRTMSTQNSTSTVDKKPFLASPLQVLSEFHPGPHRITRTHS
ncbi:catenin alpha-like [Dysidea avara]|uniref:catenin alpha-like n=1 Tax=Dysidea avara TaxID=196820 RepID=UPI00331B89D0